MIDTHIHLTDEKLKINEKEIIARFKQAGVTRAINVGYDLPSSEESARIAQENDGIYFAVGIHPDKEFTVTDEAITELKTLAVREKCVAIGEIGLDYHYEPFDKEGQKKAFERQAELASQVDLPVIVHSRDCTRDMTDIIKAVAKDLKRKGVMHCFSGSKETAKEFLDAGFYISFSGVVTFRNAKNVAEVAGYVPHDRYLAETDCPYMAPEPMRGKTNEPSFVKYVYEKLAVLRGTDLETTEKEIEENAKRLFYGIK